MLALGCGLLALAVMANGYMVVRVNENVVKAHASLDRITAIAERHVK
jgi:hypothetical protein